MSNEPIAYVLGLNCEERYDYFLSKVGEEKEIWILINEDKQFLKIHAEDDNYQYVPIWPQAEFAIDYSKDSPELSPLCIPLPEFFKKWIPGLQKDGLDIGVIPGQDSEVWITSPTELKNDIQDELALF